MTTVYKGRSCPIKRTLLPSPTLISRTTGIAIMTSRKGRRITAKIGINNVSLHFPCLTMKEKIITYPFFAVADCGESNYLSISNKKHLYALFLFRIPHSKIVFCLFFMFSLTRRFHTAHTGNAVDGSNLFFPQW